MHISWIKIFCPYLLLIVILVARSDGLKCWRCDGKNSLEECHAQFGQMQECNPGDVCQNDFRLANGKPVMIKNCKQKTACETEVKQNKDKNQCGSKLFGKNMACRCCCSTSGCNKLESGCIPPPPPCKKQRPRNGRSSCDGAVEIKIGKRCRYLCNPGYELRGNSTAVCRKDRRRKDKGYWSPSKLPTCVRRITRCNPPPEDMPNGKVRCENTKEFERFDQFNYEGTVCTYSCDTNYCLAGAGSITCQEDGEWSNTRPVCKQGSCAIIVPDANRISDCTDGYKFGSECNFHCEEGYKLVGRSDSKCLPSCTTTSGFWSQGLPSCREIRCTKLDRPDNGRLWCTDESRLGSVCTYICNEGYDLSGTVEISLTSTCEYADKTRISADWSRKPPPKCERIRCDPPRENPDNGASACSDKNWLGSSCRLSCNDGFAFEESNELVLKTHCEDDGDGDRFGEWTDAAIDCKTIECDPTNITIVNSFVTCSNGNIKDSECAIECEEGFAFKGVVNTSRLVTKCGETYSGTVRHRGTWTRINATCITIMCDGLEPLENGQTKCSSDDDRVPLATNCQFSCDRGFQLIGKRQTWCRDIKNDKDENGEWTNPPPRCILSPCQTPEYDKSRVVQDCSHPDGKNVNEHRVDTECRYRCINEGFYMIAYSSTQFVESGESVSVCLETQEWTKEPPRCEVKTCLPPLRPLTHGYPPTCSNGNKYGSTCGFKCKEKYALTQTEPLKCIADDDNDPYGVWNNEIPECKRSHCDEFGIVKHGWLNCTDGTRIGSICPLTCKERYTVKHYEETKCLETIRWSRRRFFCCVRCEFNNRIRVLAVYDASAFRTKLDWEYMVDFTESYLALMVQNGFDVEFSTLLYGRDVYSQSVFPMTRLHDRENVSAAGEHLEYACTEKCLREDAGYTGRALRYVDRTIFSEVISKERENFLILRTTGRSRDETSEIAQKLRNKGINILTIGIKAKMDSEKELLELAGRDRNYLSVHHPRDLKDVPAKMFEISKDTGCTDASKSKPCP